MLVVLPSGSLRKQELRTYVMHKDAMNLCTVFSAKHPLILRIGLPVGLTMLLFVVTMFFIMLPAFEDAMIEDKKEMIRELTRVVLELLDQYEQRVQSGELSLEDAQNRAKNRIRAMRYGSEGKDYFWIYTLEPKLIMHPYRSDLEQQDLSTYTDPQGVHVFIEFVNIVTTRGEGYVDYLWQWKDEPLRIGRKLSYVALFQPWGWIIGTGVYLEDVHEKITELTRYLQTVFLGILVLVIGLSTIIIAQGIQSENKRVHLEQMMVESEKMLLVSGLAAGTAHEITNPLGIILQSIQNIQRRLSSELDKNHTIAEECNTELEYIRQYLTRRHIFQYIQGIHEATLRASKIVSNMLQFSRQSKPDMVLTDLHQVLEKSIELAMYDYDLKKQYDFRHIRITRVYDSELPQIFCRVIEIEQVFLNLLKNAAQAIAAREKNPDYRPHILIRTHKERHYVVVNIEDNGVGMDQHILAHIFQPFYTTKISGEGTGLGLSVSYFIITNHHHGSLSASSTPGVGTVFTIRLLLNGD